MASNLKVSYTTANQQANSLVGTFTNGAILRIYDGVQPVTPETAITTQNLLATATLGNPAFGASSDGVILSEAIPSVTITASGTASWFRLLKADGATPILDGSVGTSGSDLNVNTTSFAIGATLSISSLSYTVPGV